ncbi:MAG: DNA polymerase III subunit beta [Microcystaceae cyanobacterium]
MKIICLQSDLSSHLSLVSRAVPSRPTHPVLGNVLCVADENKGQVSLTAFDLSLGIQTRFNAQVLEGGTITLPAKLLNEIVSKLPEGEITLSVDTSESDDENRLATVTAAAGRFQIRGLSAEEFPELPTIEAGESLNLPISTLSESFKGTLFAASSDETKQVLTGIHFSGKTDSLECAATDGHRLSVVEAGLTVPSDEEDEAVEEPEISNLDGFSATIPARALRELERMLGGLKDSDTLAMQVDETSVIFELGNQRLTCRKLDGAYPNYQQLIPASFSRNVILERKRLINCLELVSVLADQKNNLVKFTLDGDTGEVMLSVEAQDLGNATQSLPAEITGESGEIAFNIKYLMDGLKALPTTDIQMHLNEGNQPVIFNPLGGVKMTYLVMPVQIVR